MAGEGFRRLLGRPALGLLQTVLRESLQNVVDAAVTDEGPRVLVRIRTLTPEEKRVLTESILAERPAAPCSASLMRDSLEGEVRVLEIADFRTIGLSGPTRADLVQDGGEPPNFVNFFRNVGAGRDSHQGGGTYGYGKSAFYAISRCATILADSVTTHEGREVRRLLGCHLGAAFDVASTGARKRYTGRHWWGISDATDGVDPIGGSAAENLAGGLGLPVRGVGDTGTTILVIDPELPEDSGAEGIAREVIEGILWNFWPRMTRDCPPRRRLNVEVVAGGRPWSIPSPEEFPPLDLFARALAELRSSGAGGKAIECARPQKHLGRLAISRGLAADRNMITARPGGSLVPSPSCHIALMRPVELVVKYLKGSPFPDPRFEWAGVFICSEDDEVESAFAQSEPPAHDDWVPDNLPKGREKSFVNVALKRLKEEAVAYVQAPGARSGSGHSQEGLVGAASLLGSALAGPVAAGPGRDQSTGRRSPTARQTAVGKVTFERLMLGPSGEHIARFRCSLRNAGDDPALEVVATGFVCVDGGGDVGSGFGHEVKVVGLSLDGGAAVTNSDRLSVGRTAGQLLVDVLVPADAAVGVRVELRRGAS
jgi:hypothetical protein